MVQRAEPFKAGDCVRPLIRPVKSVDGKHRITRINGVDFVVSAVRSGEGKELRFSFLTFKEIKGEYPAFRFTKQD